MSVGIFKNGDTVRIKNGATESRYARENNGLVTTIYRMYNDRVCDLQSQIDEKPVSMLTGVYTNELELVTLDIFNELGD